MINVKQVEIARGNWLKASEELKFKIVTPYLLEINGITKTAFAYLPEYGSPNGVILGLTAAPDYETRYNFGNRQGSASKARQNLRIVLHQ